MRTFRGKQSYEEIGQESAPEGLQYQFYYVRARETGQRFTLVAANENYLSTNTNQRILQQASRILSRVDSAHVVKAYEIGEQDDLLFLVLEEVQGGLLPHWVKNRASTEPMAESMALNFFRQLAIALKDMERANVVHCYLHPTSLYVYADPTTQENAIVKIWDLPLASAGNQDFHFQAPEMLSADAQRDGEGRDIRTDIYSLGAIIYWLLAGKPPLEAGSRGQLALRIISQEEKNRPTSLAALRPDLSKPTVDLVMRCLEKQPSRRFANATELVAKLENALGNEQTAVERLLHLVEQADKRGDWEEIIRLGHSVADQPGVIKRIQVPLQKAERMLEESALNRVLDLTAKATTHLTRNQLAEAIAALEDSKQLLNNNQYIRDKQKKEQHNRVRELESRLTDQKRFQPAYLQSTHTGKTYPLALGKMTVGRTLRPHHHPDFVNLVGEPEDLVRSVSREEHATFVFEEGQWQLIHNSKATNHTYIGETTLLANQRYAVEDGAIIRFGRVELKFRLGVA